MEEKKEGAMVNKTRRIVKLREKEFQYLVGLKKKNGLDSLADAAENMVKFLQGRAKKRKMIERIIKEIEF